MKIAFVSFHLLNVTAEGLQAAKLVRILCDAGHTVEVFTSEQNWLEGRRVEPRDGPLRGTTIHRIPADAETAPAWWRHLGAWDTAGGLRGKAAALPNLLYGCRREEWSWATTTAATLLERHREQKFDVLHSRLNPPHSHLAGLLVRKRLPTLPWCAYFSDPWPLHRFPAPYAYSLGRLSRWRLGRRLRVIHQQTDALVFPSRWLLDHQVSDPAHPAAWRAKSTVAAHIGTVWDTPSAKPRDPFLRIRHAGFLMKERRIDALVEAVRALLERRPELRHALRLEFVGRYTGPEPPAPPADLTDVIVYHRYERPEAIGAWLDEADVLLLVEADLELGIFFPSKLADYLGMERPILALSPRRGIANDLLGNGASRQLVAPPADAAAIERCLETAVDAWERDKLASLLPDAEARRQVAPATVLASYERAFDHAREARA